MQEWSEPGSVLIRNTALFKSVSSVELDDHLFTGKSWYHACVSYLLDITTVKVFLAESNGDALRLAAETSEQQAY